MNRAKNLLIFLSILFIFSCQGQGNRRVIGLYKSNIELGTSSFKIIKKYGFAINKWIDKSGNNVASYVYSKPAYQISSFFPLPIFDSKFNNYEVILTFDKKGSLIDVKKFLNSMKTESWIFCESEVTNCNLNYEI